MPRRDVQKNCARCVGTNKKAATGTRRFTVDDDHYEIDLCDDHQRAFDRELSAWTRLATEIEQHVYRPMAATVERDLDRAAKRMASSLPPPPPDPSKVIVHRLPPAMKLWTLSGHAKLRCEQRGVSERDALICAADPAVTFQAPKYRGTRVRLHKRGNVIVAADSSTHTVVTVMTQAYFDSLELEQDREKESVSG